MDAEMEITNELVSNEKVINQLKTQFPHLDLEIIESVAYESSYNAELAANHLLDISQVVEPAVTNDLIVLDDEQNNKNPNFQKTIPENPNFQQTVPENPNFQHTIPENPTCQNTIPENSVSVNFPEMLNTTTNQPKLEDAFASFHMIEKSKQPVLKTNYAKVLDDVEMCWPSAAQKPPKFNIPKSPSRKSKPELNIDRVIADVKRGVKVMILLRGLPGSGKSHLANMIVKKSIGVCDARTFILTADDYFNRNGAYVFDKTKLQDAHHWAQKRALNMLTQGISPVIIDNTNTQIWEMKPYCLWAVDNSYAIEVLEPITEWAFNERELARRNVHNVPKAQIRNMLDRYEKGITVEDLFENFNLCYRKKLPPQPRSYPVIPKISVIDRILSAEGNLDSWCVLEPALVTSRETKDVTTMTGDKNEQCVIAAKDDFISAPVLPYKLPRDGFFDKGSMTEDATNVNIEIENLSRLFQGIPLEYLKDVYEKCQHDIDWTLDILLEDKKEIIENYNPPPPKEIPKKIKIEESMEESQSPVDPPKKIKQGTSDVATSLKKSLEKSVVLNPEHYTNMSSNKLREIPSTSKAVNYSSSAETLIIGTDEDMDDSSYEAIDLSDDNSDSQEETVELKVGDGFINQLSTTFGDSSFDIPSGIQTVIDVPLSLGRQLYALWLESLFKQMDMQSILMEQMLIEDEEFAVQLQAQEFMQTEVKETPNLKEIMQEQYHLSRQQRVVDEWKNLAPDDLAYKMTVEKLCNNFPETDRDTLVEILSAHGNCYKDTVESLISSGLKQENEVDATEPVNNALLMDMKVSHQSAMTDGEDVNGKSAKQLREEARDYQNKRLELFEKARSYYSKGMYPVALFYSELARKHTQMYEKFNSLAAEMFLADHFSQNNNYNTIDLHFLYVPEALEALDRFLDNNIMLLIKENKKTQEELHIITGRGKNSRHGKPKIKPAVQKRLKERGIKVEKVNSGLIRAKITRNTKMTTSL